MILNLKQKKIKARVCSREGGSDGGWYLVFTEEEKYRGPFARVKKLSSDRIVLIEDWEVQDAYSKQDFVCDIPGDVDVHRG